MRSRLAVLLLAAAAAALAAAPAASADTFTLNAPGTGVVSWNDPANWTDAPGGTDADGIPDADDDVLINPVDYWSGLYNQVDIGADNVDVHDLSIPVDPLTGDGGYAAIYGADGTTLTIHGSGDLPGLDLEGPSLHMAGGADVTASRNLTVANGSGSAGVDIDDGATFTLGRTDDPYMGYVGTAVQVWPGIRVHHGGTLNIATQTSFTYGGNIELDGATLNVGYVGPLQNATITADAASTINTAGWVQLTGQLTLAGTMNVTADQTEGAEIENLDVQPGARVVLHQAASGWLASLNGLNSGTTTFAAGSELAFDLRPGAPDMWGWASYLVQYGMPVNNAHLNFNATVTGLRTSPSSTYTYGADTFAMYMGRSTLTASTAPPLDHTGVQPSGTTLTCSPGTYNHARAAASSVEFERDGTGLGAGATHVIGSADRGHTLTCIDHATDSDANVLDAASSDAVTVPALPVVTLGAHPSGPVRTVTDTEFSGADHYRCRLDADPAAACTSPFAPTGLADGAHTIVVTGYNTAGEPESAPHTVAFALDRVAPVITATAPGGLLAPVSTQVAVASDEPATLTCDLDGVPVTPCAPRATVSLPAAGSYRFTVAATDAAGNQASKTITLTVDKAPDPKPEPDPVKPDPVQPKPDPVKPTVKPTTQALPNITDPTAPATCPAIGGLEQSGAGWQAADGASSATLTTASPAGIWRCSIRGTEHGAPVEYRSLPVLVSGHQRAMLTAESATATKVRNPRLLSTGRQRISARLYRRVHGSWKLGPRSTRFTQTVERGTNTIAFARHLKAPLAAGRYKLVVRVYTGKHTVSNALKQELNITSS